MVRKIWNRIRGFGFYSFAIGITLPIALFELFAIHSANTPGLFFTDSFLCLISIPNFFSNQLSTAAYFGRTADISFGKSQDTGTRELIGTLVGIGAALFFSIVLLSLGVQAPFIASLGTIANVFFILRFINICAGFGNRFGRYFDEDHQSRPFLEKIAVLSFQLLGFALGAGLFLTSSATLAQVIINGNSLISFFTGFAGMPSIISGLIFATSIGGLFGSFADYAMKSFGHFSTRQFPAPPNKNDHGLLNQIHQFKYPGRRYEYLGSAIGIGIGLIVAPYVMSNLMVLGLVNFSGLTGAITAITVILFTGSIYASTCSRIGRLVDAFTPKPGPSSASDTPTPNHSHIQQHDDIQHKPPSPSPTTLLSAFSIFGSFSTPNSTIPNSQGESNSNATTNTALQLN